MAALTFSNGYRMPMVGLGTWQTTDEKELEAVLTAALDAGCRHIDTAYMYMNEKIIGNVLKKYIDSGKVRREELFIVTKLPNIGMTAEKVPYFVKKSLDNLQLSYIDLYLIHGPFGLQYVDDTQIFPMKDGKVLFDFNTDLKAIWAALETEVDAGHITSLGVSNFSEEQLQRIVNVARHKPMNIQVELHAYHQQKSLRELCKRLGVTVCAYAPIGSPGRKALADKMGWKFEANGLLEDPIVAKIAKNHGKTPAQVLLRFLIQLEIAVIPKSSNPKRILENLKATEFELSSNEMKELESLDKGDAGRTFGFEHVAGLTDHPEYPFKQRK